MAWRVGIDEAGWGPNLGPFVMTAVAIQLANQAEDLWERLGQAVCRQVGKGDRRLVVADSKKVYLPEKGLGDLERTVLTTMNASAADLRQLLEQLAPDSVAELQGECWYRGELTLPRVAESFDDQANITWRHSLMEAGAEVVLIRSILVCPARFNALTTKEGTKAAVSTWAVRELIGECLGRAEAAGHDLHIDVDKQGGRNRYVDLLQPVFASGFVWARAEGADRSHYFVQGLPRNVEVNFTPRADGACFCVALASMVSKYLRELMMIEFNAFWRSQVPGLKPTAGYPLDAKRFMDSIRPTLGVLDLHEDMIWRKK